MQGNAQFNYPLALFALTLVKRFVAAIALGCIASMFTLAIVSCFGCFSFEYDWDEICSFVLPVAERLVLGKATCAIGVLFASFNFNLFWETSGDCRFGLIHRFDSGIELRK